MNSAWGTRSIKYWSSDTHGACLWKIDGMSFIKIKHDYFDKSKINGLYNVGMILKSQITRL